MYRLGFGVDYRPIPRFCLFALAVYQRQLWRLDQGNYIWNAYSWQATGEVGARYFLGQR